MTVAVTAHCLLATAAPEANNAGNRFDIVAIERPRMMAQAVAYLKEEPVTVTASHCDRSPGGPHDFFSEADYFWPDPQHPDGPYVHHDGLSNTNNFVKHRHAMIRMSRIVGATASAYLLTGDDQYVRHAVKHLKAWFVDEGTKMNPNLEFSQGVKGLSTGRSAGVIDTLHLVEVARGAQILSQSPAFPAKDYAAVQAWFRDYLKWMNTHPYGLEERAKTNNHGICWSMQAAAFARLVGDEQQLEWVRHRFKTLYLGTSMATNGGFTAELGRTKPYGYSLFVIDAMAGIAQIASAPRNNLWTYTLPDGRSLQKGMEFIVPFIVDKSKWPKPPDVLYWDEWPVRQPSLLFAGINLNQPEYLKIWEKLKGDSTTPEVLRNLPLRYPLLWVGPQKPEKIP